MPVPRSPKQQAVVVIDVANDFVFSPGVIADEIGRAHV